MQVVEYIYLICAAVTVFNVMKLAKLTKVENMLVLSKTKCHKDLV